MLYCTHFSIDTPCYTVKPFAIAMQYSQAVEHGEVQFGMQEYEDGELVQEMVAGWRKGLVDRLEAAERPPMQHCTMRLSHCKNGN